MFTNWHDITKRSIKPMEGGIVTAQIQWELYELINLYDELQPRHVLEIGSQFGGTLYYWLEGAEEGAKVAAGISSPPDRGRGGPVKPGRSGGAFTLPIPPIASFNPAMKRMRWTAARRLLTCLAPGGTA